MLNLYRVVNTHHSTKGVLVYENRVLCHTLELPWNYNAQNISCIPTGLYDLVRSTSSRHGDCFRVPNVIGRSGILFHAGNTIADTQGCILPGLDVNLSGVLHSQLAMDRLLSELPESLQFHIRTF